MVEFFRIDWLSKYKKIRNFTHYNKYKLICKYSLGKTLLDIGCGSGELLFLFKNVVSGGIKRRLVDNVSVFICQKICLHIEKPKL